MADVTHDTRTFARTDVGESRSYVCWRVGSLTLAVETVDVEEITDFREPVLLPRAPAHLLGLMPVRGRPVPLVWLGTVMHERRAA